MKVKRYDLWNETEYTYPMAYGFVPNLVSYLHEDEKIRPCMLVIPGGGYSVVAPSEGEIVARKFYEKGFQAFVLTYTTNFLLAEPLKKQPMYDLSRAIRVIRRNADEFCVIPNQLALCGFSAGGHLAGSVCVHSQDIIDENKQYAGISNRPDAAILSYPVITTGEYASKVSFRALLGDDAGVKELEYMSLEKQVSADTPPCFLWQTVTDESVPVENSYLFADACRKQQVTFAHHVFSTGEHGLSLADEVWASEEYGTLYTKEQIVKIEEKAKAGMIPKALLSQLELQDKQEKLREPNDEVRVWPELAENWLRNVCDFRL